MYSYSSTFVKRAKVLVLVLEYFWSTQYSYSSTLKVLGPNSAGHKPLEKNGNSQFPIEEISVIPTSPEQGM